MSDAVLPTPSRTGSRVWRTPTVTELPKLSALTLASPIGGGGGTGGGGSTVFGLLLALILGLSACSAERELGGGPDTLLVPVSQLVTCVADRGTRTLECRSPEAAPGTTILGGQGTRVGLRSSGVSYDGGSGILSADVTVQNLSAGSLGTLDGTTPSLEGIRVFFASGPNASPAGTVTVNNPTGIATFLSGPTPYYEWTGVMLAPQAITAPMTWEFLFAGGATSFTFSVLVSTDLPAVGAISRWAEEPGVNPTNWQAIGGWGSDGLALFGQYGEVIVRDSGKWSSRNDPSGEEANGPVVANGPNDITTFTSDFSTRRWDGISWRAIEGLSNGPGDGGLVNFVGGSGKSGACAFGFDLRCFDGSSWTDLAFDASVNRAAASTVIGGNIVILTDQGRVWSRDSSSGAWTQIGGVGGSGQTQGPGVIFGTSTSNLWTLSTVNNSDDVIRYWDGSSWSTQAVPSGQDNSTGVPAAGVAFSATDAYILRPDGAGHGHVWHWDGSAWTDIKTSTFNYTGIWARSSSEIYVSAAAGRLLFDSAGTWSELFGAAESARAAWMLNGSTAYLGTDAGSILQNTGAGWSSIASLGGSIRSIWADGGSSVAVTNGSNTLWYYNGSGWAGSAPNSFAWHGTGGSGGDDIWYVGQYGQIYHGAPGAGGGMAEEPGDLTFNDLYAVWALDPNFAVAVGQSGEMSRWNGSTWQRDNPLTGNALRSVWGTSASDVWAVGDGGLIFHYDGIAWDTVASGTGQDLHGVWAASSGEAYAVGANKTVLVYNGSGWSAATVQTTVTGVTYYDVHGLPGGQVLVAGERVLRGLR